KSPAKKMHTPMSVSYVELGMGFSKKLATPMGRNTSGRPAAAFTKYVRRSSNKKRLNPPVAQRQTARLTGVIGANQSRSKNWRIFFIGSPPSWARLVLSRPAQFQLGLSLFRALQDSERRCFPGRVACCLCRNTLPCRSTRGRRAGLRHLANRADSNLPRALPHVHKSHEQCCSF